MQQQQLTLEVLLCHKTSPSEVEKSETTHSFDGILDSFYSQLSIALLFNSLSIPILRQIKETFLKV